MPDLTVAEGVVPRGPADLFRVFNRMAMQGFGGVLAVAQRELVEREGWLTREQFVELLSVSQVLPGPNVINLALAFGDRCCGLRGAVAAAGGLLALPLVIVLTAAVLYGRLSQVPAVAGALRGMVPVAAGLVLVTAIKLAGALARNPLGPPVCALFAAAIFGAMALLHWPLVAVLPALGVVAVMLAWWRIGNR